jgi:hypothetical protein
MRFGLLKSINQGLQLLDVAGFAGDDARRQEPGKHANMDFASKWDEMPEDLPEHLRSVIPQSREVVDEAGSQEKWPRGICRDELNQLCRIVIDQEHTHSVVEENVVGECYALL